MRKEEGGSEPAVVQFMKENEFRADAVLVRVIIVLTLMELGWIWLMKSDNISVYERSHSMMYLEIVLKAVAILAYFAMSRLKLSGYRYLALSILMVHSYIVSAYISYNLMILMVLPALLTTLYNDRRLLAVTAPLGLVLMLYSLWVYNSHTTLFLGFWYGMTDWDILKALIKSYYVYSLAAYAVILVIAVYSTKKGIGDTRSAADLKARAIMSGRELEIASSIQMGMIPSSLPESPELRVCAEVVPAREVGGDFYDCFTMKDGRVVFLMADVSGKGVPAALFMMSAASVLHSVLDSGMSLEDAVYKANNDVFRSNRMRYFVTLWLGILDPRDGSLEYVNAGHNPPFIVSEGKVSKIESRPDFVFGRKRDIRFRSHRTVIGRGDRLFLYTDGVTEARSSDGGMFGEQRLVRTLGRTSGGDAADVLSGLREDVSSFTNGAPQSDDITVMAADYTGPGDGTLKITADRAGYEDAMSYLDRVLDTSGCDSSGVSEMKTICSEIFANIDMYGFTGREKGTVEFSVRIEGGRAVMTFSDDGIPFNPLEQACMGISDDPRDHRNGGLGIILVRKLSQEQSYLNADGRNILTITKEL